MASDPAWINRVETSPGVFEPAYNAQELRRLEAAQWQQAGTADRFGARQGVHPAGAPAVSLSGTTVTVQHTKAVVYPGLTTLSGPYTVALPSTTHELDPADGSNPRKDLIVLRVYDDDEDSSSRREAVSEYIAGTPAATPAEPTLPAGAMRLATIDVPVNGGGAATLDYNAQWTVASGGVIPVRDDTELPGTDGGLYDGAVRWNQALDELQVHNGAATWEALASPLGFTQALSGGVVLDEINGGAGTNTTEFANIDQTYDWLMIMWRGNHDGAAADFSQLAIRFNDDAGATSYRRQRWNIGDTGLDVTTTGDFSTGHAGQVGSSTGSGGIIWIPTYSTGSLTKSALAINILYSYPTANQIGTSAGQFRWQGGTDAITKIRMWPGSRLWGNPLFAVLIGFKGGI